MALVAVSIRTPRRSLGIKKSFFFVGITIGEGNRAPRGRPKTLQRRSLNGNKEPKIPTLRVRLSQGTPMAPTRLTKGCTQYRNVFVFGYVFVFVFFVFVSLLFLRAS